MAVTELQTGLALTLRLQPWTLAGPARRLSAETTSSHVVIAADMWPVDMKDQSLVSGPHANCCLYIPAQVSYDCAEALLMSPASTSNSMLHSLMTVMFKPHHSSVRLPLQWLRSILWQGHARMQCPIPTKCQ